MTKVMTRYFEDAAQGHAARKALVYERGVPPSIVRVLDSAEGLARALASAQVNPRTAEVYLERMEQGGAVLLVQAGYKPLGVARIVRQVMAAKGGADLKGLIEEVTVKDKLAPPVPKVLAGQPLLMTRLRDPSSTTHHMADWPIPLIIKRRPSPPPVFPPHARMAAWPIPLLSQRKPSDNFAFPRHARMANFPIPLLSDRKPSDKFAFPRHARMANFPIPLISRRKPYTGSLIPRHGRLATWPFPLLINGKTGTNALMPGGPRMANWPIRLISQRKPSDAFAFPRHARMANFPIPLLSERKPSDKFAFPRHKRMAAFPLPLLIPRDGSGGFSLSKMLGLPTLLRR